MIECRRMTRNGKRRFWFVKHFLSQDEHYLDSSSDTVMERQGPEHAQKLF